MILRRSVLLVLTSSAAAVFLSISCGGNGSKRLGNSVGGGGGDDSTGFAVGVATHGASTSTSASTTTSAGGATGETGGAGNGTGGGVTCKGGILCGETCVDTTSDPLNCGHCGESCAPGEVCSASSCLAIDDCSKQPCVGLSYCDPTTKKCEPGCMDASQCSGGQTCDPSTHTCTCSSSQHLCSGVCADQASPNTCGASCTPCPTNPFGTATCDGNQCGLACNQNTWSCASGCCGFTQQSVATASGSPEVSLAIDSSGTPHVAYTSTTGTTYAVRSGSTWSTQSVDSTGYRFASIALNAQSQPWIAFESYVAPSFALKVARFGGSSFTIDDVSDAGCCDQGLALRFNTADTAVLAYAYDLQNNGGSLRGFTSSGATWTYGGASAGITYRPFGMAFDASSTTHLGYTNWEGGIYDLVYGKVNPTSMIVDSTPDNGHDTDMSISGSHEGIVYCGTDGVHYGSSNGSGWTKEVVTSTSYEACAIAMDSAGAPHLVFYTYEEPLMYATKDNGTWKLIQIAPSADSAAIATDAAGNPGVVYATGGALEYAFVD